MKASRKLSRSSFIMQVAGDGGAGGGALKTLSGKGKGGGPAGDHDLAYPPGGASADPDSGPPAGPDGRPR